MAARQQSEETQRQLSQRALDSADVIAAALRTQLRQSGTFDEVGGALRRVWGLVRMIRSALLPCQCLLLLHAAAGGDTVLFYFGCKSVLCPVCPAAVLLV